MKKTRPSILLALLMVAALMVALSGCTKLKARDQINKGVRAYSASEYAEAVEYFKSAVELDPSLTVARLYLGTSYLSQYIPGAESEENLRMADLAESEFLKVLETEPDNSSAIHSLGSLSFQMKNYDESEKWFRRLIEVAPETKEAYYTLGVIAWQRTFQPRMEARAEIGMMPEDPGPIKDAEVREALREKNLPIIESGIDMLEKGLQVDPEYDDAMAYLNLLYRERADLEDTPEAYERDISEAENWVDKTLATKKIKAARSQQASFGMTE